MKKLLIVLLSIFMLTTVANAATEYNNDNTETMIRQNSSQQVNINREMWNQTISSYENSYNDSMKKYWDEYTAAYQRQKKIQR